MVNNETKKEIINLAVSELDRVCTELNFRRKLDEIELNEDILKLCPLTCLHYFDETTVHKAHRVAGYLMLCNFLIITYSYI